MSVDPDPALDAQLRDHTAGPILVTTERERPEVAVQAYHVVVTHHRPGLHLIVVGDHLDDDRRRVLREYGRQLNLDGLWVTDPLTDAQRAAVDKHAAAWVDVVDGPLVTAEALLRNLHVWSGHAGSDAQISQGAGA
jgi:hypothetical protein